MEIHLQLLTDLRPTCLCSTASMALLVAEEVHKRGLRDRIALKKIIFGAEPHTDKMRRRFEEWLGVQESFDITGMTELYGPGMGLECEAHQGIHYWADQYILEILDPLTMEPVAPGEVGEMVVTSLAKEAAPLIRYRTRDLTRLIPGDCPCGLSLPRHDRIVGRSDDMFVFRGVNIYPGQIASVLGKFPDVDSEFQIRLLRRDGRDQMVLRVERKESASADMDQNLSDAIAIELRKLLLVRSWVEILPPTSLPRSCGKTKRVIDDRNGLDD